MLIDQIYPIMDLILNGNSSQFISPWWKPASRELEPFTIYNTSIAMDRPLNEDDNTAMFIDLSKQLIEKGDLEHAERLLRGGLLRAEKKKEEAESAVRGLKAELIKLYKMQGREDKLSNLDTPDSKEQ